MLIHVGTDEVLLDDSTRLAERCREAGVDVTLKVFEGMWHEFQIHAGLLKESDEAAAEIGEFLKSHFADTGGYDRLNPLGVNTFEGVGVGDAFDRGDVC
jgi:acetyl esterase/lipase